MIIVFSFGSQFNFYRKNSRPTKVIERHSLPQVSYFGLSVSGMEAESFVS